MIVLGRNANPDLHPTVQEVYLTDQARKQGTYVIGTTGTGKTTLLLNMIYQDMQQPGEGLCVLDPHGDFTLDILQRVPKHRLDDVILFDSNDTEYPFGLNVFDCNKDDPRERDRVVSTVIDTLYKLFQDSWGPRMEDLLRHSVLSLLLHPEPTTMIDLMLLLVSQEHRARLTQEAKAKDPILRTFWEEQFGRYNQREQIEVVGSSLNKIGRFIANPIIRHIVGQPKSTVNLRQIMDEGKILLVNLSKGDLGADNSSLLGSVLVNQLLIAALSRRNIPEKQRRPFHLYVDEYQTFATKSFPELQSEARKYAIDTVVAHQYRDQLDMENRGSTLNVANLVVLRVSGKDSIELAGQFDNTPPPAEPRFEAAYQPIDDRGQLWAKVETAASGVGLYQMVEGYQQPYSDVHLEMANTLAQIPNHQAICRVLSTSQSPRTLYQFRIDLTAKPAVNERVGEQITHHIRQNSRQQAAFTQTTIAEYIAEHTKSSTESDTYHSYIPAFDTQ